MEFSRQVRNTKLEISVSNPSVYIFNKYAVKKIHLSDFLPVPSFFGTNEMDLWS